MLPTLRQLRYLKLLDEHGSFSRAAQAAHVTQPTLSAGVQELERILGEALVDRNRSGIILTAAGAEVASRAGVILAQAEDLVESARGAGQPLCGRFRLGVIPTIAPFLLPTALPVLRRRYSDLKLFLREDLTQRLIADLRSGGLDAALIALPYDTQGLDWAHVENDELVVAFPAGHDLGRTPTITSERLETEDLILLEDGHCLRDHALAACGLTSRGRLRDDGFVATSLATLIHMVGSGLGVSFLPAMAVNAGLDQSAEVEVRAIAAEHASREIVIAWRAGSRRAVEGRLLAEVFAGAWPSPRPAVEGHRQQ